MQKSLFCRSDRNVCELSNQIQKCFLHRLLLLIRIANGEKGPSCKAIFIDITIPDSFFVMKVYFVSMFGPISFLYSQ